MQEKPRHASRIHLLLLLFFALGAIVLCPFSGMHRIHPAEVFQNSLNTLDARIFWHLRVPRVLTAFLAGLGLSLGGMCFQAIFRNPLATPFTLGVSSGASLGVALYVRLGLAFSVFGIAGTPVFAFLGALLAIGAVYGLTRLKGNCSTATMLLAGVAISFFFSSLILFLQYLSDFTHTFRIVRWLMGGIEGATTGDLAGVAIFVLIGSILVGTHLNELNLLMVDEEFAKSRGVQVERTKTVFLVGISLMVGGIVAVCGPIGFVGMICPHICRLIFGTNHRSLGPSTALFGGTFLLLCDTIARQLVAPAEIPVGVITALLGGPFFLWLLFGRGLDRS